MLYDENTKQERMSKMLGVLMCYVMLQMVLQEGIRKEEEEDALKAGEECTSNKHIKSRWRKSA